MLAALATELPAVELSGIDHDNNWNFLYSETDGQRSIVDAFNAYFADSGQLSEQQKDLVETAFVAEYADIDRFDVTKEMVEAALEVLDIALALASAGMDEV